MEKEKALFRVHFSSLSNVVAGLPFFATLFCVAWSVYFNFEESTATHCRVPYCGSLLPFPHAIFSGEMEEVVFDTGRTVHSSTRGGEFCVSCAHVHFVFR